MRVVSCVPSLTELAEFLLPGCVVGRTTYCIAPEEMRKVPSVGGTKNIDVEAVKNLFPDLVLAAKEENIQDQVERIATFSKVEVFDIKTIGDALLAILQMGQLLQSNMEANLLVEAIKPSVLSWPEFNSKSVAYLIWKKPWMTVGHDTYIHHVLTKLGFTNLFGDKTRYPVIEDMTELASQRPDYLLLSSEPFPFREKHVGELAGLFPETKILLVDGTYFSWYGSRILKAAAYFQAALPR